MTSSSSIPFLCSDKKSLHLPNDMPTLQFDYTLYFYPGQEDAKGMTYPDMSIVTSPTILFRHTNFKLLSLFISFVIIWRAKLLKYDWLMRRAFFLNSGQKFLDPDCLRRFILSIRTKYQKHTQ